MSPERDQTGLPITSGPEWLEGTLFESQETEAGLMELEPATTMDATTSELRVSDNDGSEDVSVQEGPIRAASIATGKRKGKKGIRRSEDGKNQPFHNNSQGFEVVQRLDPLVEESVRDTDRKREEKVSTPDKKTSQMAPQPHMSPELELQPGYEFEESSSDESDGHVASNSESRRGHRLHSPRNSSRHIYNPYQGTIPYLGYYPSYPYYMQPYSAPRPPFYPPAYGYEAAQQSQNTEMYQEPARPNTVDRTKGKAIVSSQDSREKKRGHKGPHASSYASSSGHLRSPAIRQVEGKKMKMKKKAALSGEDYYSDRADSIRSSETTRPMGRKSPSHVVVASGSDEESIRRSDRSEDQRYTQSPQTYSRPMLRSPDEISSQQRSSETKRTKRQPFYHHAVHGTASAPEFMPVPVRETSRARADMAPSASSIPTPLNFRQAPLRSDSKLLPFLRTNDDQSRVLQKTLATVLVPHSASPDEENRPHNDEVYARKAVSEGLVIAVSIQCSHATLHSRFSTLLYQNWPERTAHNDNGDAVVRKAVNAKRFKKRDGSHSVELSCGHGPSPQQSDKAYQIQWLHLKRCRMDLAEFENMCLNAPKISGDLRFVVLRLFKHIQDTFRKSFFDGFSINPGTVLRCDGTSSRSTDNHELSATFICFPYLSMGPRRPNSRPPAQDYPTRSILQILYPYESTLNGESAPSFCKDMPHASDHILYVPQIWVVIIGSKYVVTCTEIESNDMLGSSVSIVPAHSSIERLPPLTGDWLPVLDHRHKTLQKSPSEKLVDSEIEQTSTRSVTFEAHCSHTNSNDQSSIASVPLFDGKRVEEFLIADDDEPVQSAGSSACNRTADIINTSTIDNETHGTRSQYEYPSGQDADENDDEAVPGDCGVSRISPMLLASFPNHANASSEDTQVLGTTEKTSIDVELEEERSSIMSMLKSLKAPQMTTQYLEAVQTCLTHILHIWRKIPRSVQRDQLEIRLEQSIPRAEMLRSMCDLELQDSVFARQLGYREAMLKALGIKDSSFQKELDNLGDVINDTMNLLNSGICTVTSGTNEAADVALANQADPIHDSMRTQTESKEMTHTIKRRNTPPFLTWAWLSSEFDKSVTPDRLAAENLFAIMEDIDRNLRRRNEVSYTFAMEISLAELEKKVASLVKPPNPADNIISLTETVISSRHRGYVDSPSTLGWPIGELFAEDALHREQKNALCIAIDELFATAKNFVGLFIPHSYPHSVSKRIWGSLSLLLKSATSTLDEDERSKHNYIIRPLGKGFIEKHKIDQPLFALQDCSLCRDGAVYKSKQDAVQHLKRVHFRDDSPLRELTHLRTAYDHWVRKENQVRNELANKHRLRLLQICLNYLKVLYTRAEKIHQGISQEEQTDMAKYQLPNDLVDCFEATGLFIMSSATSLIAIEDEMRQWQHVPGNSLEELNTPTIHYTLEQLGELGQAAQASMTRAEKTLALSDPDTNMVSMGAAGPELLASVLLQNVQRKELLHGVNMHVNQLYQEYTSKLQYQINQFPRKRLLRDIHALQEELSVVQSVNLWQQQSLDSLMKVLDPQSFETPTSDRVNMFLPESECLKEGLKNLQSKAVELGALESRTQYLREQLKQSVEILEEDHGKAILVFTMITTIFLPLSFVTSFFGMNTSDIRNTNKSQGFFWAIAIPVTACIVFAAVLLAYHGDKLYDAIVQAVHQLREQQAVIRATQAEPGQLSEKTLPLHSLSWTSRRRSGFGLQRLVSETLRPH